MKNLSISQKYFLFVMNQQGKLSATNYYPSICLVMAVLLDLQKAEVIEISKKEVQVLTNRVPENLSFLTCLLTKVASMKKKTVEKIADAYVGSISNKEMKLLIKEVFDSLNEQGEIQEDSKANSFSKEKKIFLPKEATITQLTAALKSLNQEDSQGFALAVLLKKSNYLRRYLDKPALKDLNTKLKETKNNPVSKQTQQMINQIDTIFVAVATIVMM